MVDIGSLTGFDWDEGNLDKNWLKHQVSNAECEEVFFNLPLLLTPDRKHSQAESRYYVLGQTNAQRWLFVAFAVREHRIRVISARDMNRKEESIYAQANS